ILISYSTASILIEVDLEKFRPSDLPVMKGDNTKIKNDIGWSPSIPIHTTLLDLLDYWRKNA
ncbi:MAG: GDP-mannose 4,6-dehydratase, partial [Gammaproteobacteria bacterium]|nr:GDP-mannose 4,6-dehydratase [Gammaproteobacteria bacterium]